MMMTCAQCGQEIVGAVVTTGRVDGGAYAAEWTTVPGVIAAHNSLCALVYPGRGLVADEPATTNRKA